MDPKNTVALWALGRLYSEQLPQIALQWLELGLDSPTLRILAGETNPIMSDVGPMFETVLEELEFAVPARDDVVTQFLKGVSCRIVAGTVLPYEGACEIERILYDYEDVADEKFSGIFEFLTLEYEEFVHEIHRKYSEAQRQRIKAELDAKIIEEARKILAANSSINS